MILRIKTSGFLRRVLLVTVILLLHVSPLKHAAHGHTSLPPMINIGAIFETDDQQLQTTLLQAVNRINQNGMLLPKTRLNVTSYVVEARDSFNGAKLVCKLLNDHVWAIISSKSDSIKWFVRSLANDLQVPHLSVNWNYRSKFMFNINQDMDAENGQKRTGNNNYMTNGDNGGASMMNTVGIGTNLDWLTANYGAIKPRTVYNRSTNSFGVGPRSEYPPLPGYGVPLQQVEQHFTINLFPDANELGGAFLDLIVSRNWKSFTFIYDKYEGLIAMKDILRVTAEVTKREVKMTVIEFASEERAQTEAKNVADYDAAGRGHRNADPLEEEYIYKKLLKSIKKSEHNYVLFLSREKTMHFLQEAYNSNRMSEYDNFLVATLDIHRMDLSEFQHRETLANITGFSVLTSPPQDELALGNVLDYQRQFYGRRPSSSSSSSNLNHPQGYQLRTTEALIYDAITLFASTVSELDRRLEPEEIAEPFLNCEDRTAKWHFGATLVSHMRQMKIDGMTGPIAFDSRGHRVNFSLDIMQLKNDGLKNVAKWSKTSGIVSTANYTFYDSYKQILEAMKYKELIIVTPLPNNKPYLYLKDNHHEFNGNDRYDGFCMDLLKMIAEVFRSDEFQSDFKYQIVIDPDGVTGQPNKETGEWNGMIGQLMRHQADLAIADLTATYLRETVVDFTMPFMNLGIAILFKKTAIPDPELFSFLKPLSVEVWLYLASAFLGISIILWLLSRISPYEWVSPHSCDPEPLELENQFSIGNSLWFTIGSLMQQGSDLAPRALSTRTLAAVWWFFTLIMISSYTANLAASLTLSRMAPAISNVEDLAKQTQIQYGCRKGGSTYEFFQNSNHTTYQRMFNTMESNPEVYIPKIEDAIDRVKKGGYAYLAESSTIEYLVQRKCDLYQVGTWLDNKGYGIATPTDSPYRTPISNAIVVLQDQGKLYELKKKWWVENGGGLCQEPAVTSQELNIENVGGVFVVLGAGVAIGCFFGALEFIWKSLKIARHERDSVGKLIWLEIVRICTGGSSSRPVYQSQSSSNIANNTNGDTPTGNGMTKVPSANSMSGYNIPNSPSSYDFRAMSPPPPPHPFHMRQLPSYNSYDSTMPLLSPSSAPGKSLSRVNSGTNTAKSPSAFSNMY